MHCPFCRANDTRVVDSRVTEDGSSIRRRRTCSACGQRFTTVEQMQLTIVKRSGASEPFEREKAVAGVRKACKGRPVDEDQLACLGQAVEDALRASGSAAIPAHEVGLAILGPLRELDEVAYLRFASVYRAFTSAADFEDEIAQMRRDGAARPAHAPDEAPSADREPQPASTG
ncbi:transcriptional regulator NrdR [Nocardioides sp. GY 10127]|uniref:transcriptional regulator NrdR n=1 Tax=Nocardioides sp. GY 10127 TaxID=2569762 RepID=UPI0010A7EA50|nr:transcriptional regulator NrdR [Nocardioides sp. GY 10127]TIC84451.1 transcriptional repressor NrdR [Nocardioides sp. GY 10127]